MTAAINFVLADSATDLVLDNQQGLVLVLTCAQHQIGVQRQGSDANTGRVIHCRDSPVETGRSNSLLRGAGHA